MQERSKLSFLITVCITVMGASYAADGKEPLARLSVQISDKSTGQSTEARVRITHADGQLASIPEVGISVMYGRDSRVDGYSFQPDGAFYVDGGGFHNPATAQGNLDQAEKYLREIEERIAVPGFRVKYQAWRYKEGLEERIAETRKIMAELRTKLK